MKNKIVTITTPVGTIEVAGPKNDTSVMSLMEKNGQWEYVNQLVMKELIEPDFVCLDIGANLGQHSVVMSKLASSVYAVEASKTNCSYIHDNIILNHCANIGVINEGLWDEVCTKHLCYSEDNNACAFFNETGYVDDGVELIPVRMNTIDNLFGDLERVDFVKMDIEGSELKALNGGKSVFKKHKPILMMELNKFTAEKFMGYKISALLDKMEDFGYKKLILATKNNGFTLHEVKRPQVLSLVDRYTLVDVIFLP